MRLTQALFKFNVWRLRTSHWKVQRKRKVFGNNLKNQLEEQDITVYDALEVAKIPKPTSTDFEIVGQGPLRPQLGSTDHPDFHENRILCYKDNNVLLSGLEQAKLLTNTVEPEGKVLPKQLNNLIGAISFPKQDKLVKKCINSSLVYDAEQVKLPIKKNPEKPAWIFARDYGISDKRRNYLICKKLLQLCETISHLNESHVVEEKFIGEDARFSVPLKWNETQLLFDLRADLFVASKSALQPLDNPDNHKHLALPDIGPISPTISLDETNFYDLTDKFPMKSGPQDLQVHTAIVHYNETEVSNVYGTPVEEHQIEGRTLLKAYAFAVAQARQNYGVQSSGPVPVPVTIQTIHTNCQWFQFSILQLNTFDMHGGSLRNYYWSTPFINLYSFCGYEEGRPVLKDYNPEVFKTLLAFYNH